jgi:hypothetical protein
MKKELPIPIERLIHSRWIAVVLLVLFAAALRIPGMSQVKRTGWDESAYAFFARTWSREGGAGIRRLIQDYRHDERLQKSPLPLRVAFIVAGAATCTLMGGFTPDHLAWLSFGAGLTMVAAGTLFAWEITANAVIAWLTGLLLTTSPLAAGLSLRATQDSFMGLITIVAIWLFYRASHRSSLVNCTLLGLCLLVGFLTKETLVFIYPLLCFAMAWQYFREKMKIAWQVLIPLTLAPVLYFIIASMLCEGVANYISTYEFYRTLQEKLAYTVHYEKGPWHAYFVDFLAISPLVIFVVIAGLAALQSPTKEKTGYGLCILWFAGSCLVFGMLPVINIRLLLFADVFLRVAAATSVCKLYKLCPLPVVLCGLVFCGLLVNDWCMYQHIFIEGRLYSPTHFLLFNSMGFYDVDL